MPLGDPDVAAREAAAPIPMLQRSSQRRGNRPRPGPHLHHSPVLVVSHQHPARVARQALRRSRGNVAPPFQHGLAGLLRIREDCGVYVDHHLIPFTRRSGVELMVQRRLGQQRQRVRVLLRPGRRLHGRVGVRQAGPGDASPLIEGLAGGVEGPQEQRAHLRRQAPAQHHSAVLILVDVERAGCVLSPGLAGFGLPVHPAPAPHDALHVDRRPGAPHRQQPGLSLRGCHAGDGADLGVGELAARQGLGQGWQCPEGAGHPDPLTSGPWLEPHAPGQPRRARAEAGVPAPAGVEFPDKGEQPGRRRLEVSGELGDLVAQAIQLRNARRRGQERDRKIRRACLHGESPFCWNNSNPRFRRRLGPPTSRERGMRHDRSYRTT